TPNAVASVRGTTFATIGLFAPNWFFMGFDGETIVQTDEGEQFTLGEDDCVRVSEDGKVRRCTKAELEKLTVDFVLVQWAYQGGELEPQASASPSASPSPSPVLRSSGGGGGGSPTTAEPSPAPRGRKPSINTPGPDGKADDKTDEPPSPSPSPTEEPTEEPTPTPTVSV
ncbi:MAG: hypothetical protein ACRDKJ_13385, partial [Actinomycetota bacterium]